MPPDSLSIEDELDRIMRHPCFAAAGRLLSQNMLALAERDRALDGIVKDAGRYIATALAVYLHATGGLTLPRLKALCAQSGVISPGRARAILLYLRFLKYVEPVTGGGRAGVYAPTAGLLNAWDTLARGGLDAAAILDPAIARLSNRLGDPAVMRAATRIACERGLSLSNRGTKDNALWRAFLNRHAGTQILHALMLGAGPDDHYPPRGEIPFALTALARRFHVSRPHIARLLRAAEAEGLVTLPGENRLVFTQAGRDAVAILLALRLSTDLHAAAALRVELDVATLRLTG